MSQKRNVLEVDPTIVERNLTITDPQNDEFQQLLSSIKSETPSKLVKPSPGFCVKTHTESNEKVFLNICHTEAIPAPEDISEGQLMEILQSETPSEYRIPMSLGEPRPEVDKSGKNATAYDIAINPTFLNKVENNKLFKQFFLSVVFEGVQDKYKIQLKINDITILKNRKAMGNLQLHRIQQREINKKMNKEKKLIEEVSSKPNLITEQEITKEPPHRLAKMISKNNVIYVADFYLPDITSTKDITLDVGEDRIILEAKKKGYFTDFFVPQRVDPKNVKANFNKNLGMLTIVMPII